MDKHKELETDSPGTTSRSSQKILVKQRVEIMSTEAQESTELQAQKSPQKSSGASNTEAQESTELWRRQNV